MTEPVTRPYYRRGTALGETNTIVVQAAEGGWEWRHHRQPTGVNLSDHGRLFQRGGPFETREAAGRAADDWFEGIDDIRETTGRHEG